MGTLNAPERTGPASALVTVVIPTHGRPELVRRAIASVVGQDYPGPIEIIVVHDKEPADPSVESSDPRRRVRAVENDHTPGLAGARNAGLARATGEFVASLDDDDYWATGKVSAQVAALEADASLGVVATGVILHTGDGRVAERPLIGPLITHHDLMTDRIADLHSSNLFMRRRLFDEVGDYDEQLVGVEDWEWLLRASRQHPIGVVQQRLTHVFRDTPLWNPRRWQRIARAHEQILERHPDILTQPASAGYFNGKLAFAYAAGGERRRAIRCGSRALRQRAKNPWALAALCVALLRIPVRFVQVSANRLGKSI